MVTITNHYKWERRHCSGPVFFSSVVCVSIFCCYI